MDILKMVIDLFGPTVFVPVVVFILSLCMRVEVDKAFRGALYMGIGLTAFNIILGGLMGSLGPIVTEMVENTGVNLPVIDIGWPAASVICYANQVGMFFIPFGLIFDLILFTTKWTDTFHPTDIWNYYFFVFWAAIVQFATGSFFLAVLAGMLLNLILLLLADWIAPSMECYYGYQGVVSTCFCSVNSVPFAILMKWVLGKLKLDKINLKPSELREKFGFWGEPVTMGLLIGFAVSMIAKWQFLGDVASWATILKTAITTGAVMAIYPSVSGLFVKGLIPITNTLNARMRSGQTKRKNMYIAIDPAVFFGEEGNMATGLVLIPVMLAFAVFTPGNIVLPLADLPALPFMTIGIVAVMQGNVFSAVITGIIWLGFGFLVNSDVAQIFTEAARAVNAIPESAGAAGVSCLLVGHNFFGWLVYKAFAAPEAIRMFTIAAAFACYFIVYFFFRKYRKAWQLAAGATEEYFAEKEALWKQMEEAGK
ncbi:MAG: PTS sugar transporter subunit IIC [Clostridia bacterium]|mgnify:CR=1 FL=1|jgi:PTS system galactitol-specific IIC component|nr:PTS sugar transporter subunit IIC [Clostridia bacterium]